MPLKGKKHENTSATRVATENAAELISESSSKLIIDFWILDSSCCFHIYENKDWFATYKKKGGGKVIMGNDFVCKAISVGTAKVKMYDGIMHTFDNVQHVLYLKKNLISFGTLDENGITYSSIGGSMKICNGSLVAMRRVKLCRNLCKFIGNTVEDEATVSTLKVANEVTTHLCGTTALAM